MDAAILTDFPSLDTTTTEQVLWIRAGEEALDKLDPVADRDKYLYVGDVCFCVEGDPSLDNPVCFVGIVDSTKHPNGRGQVCDFDVKLAFNCELSGLTSIHLCSKVGCTSTAAVEGHSLTWGKFLGVKQLQTYLLIAEHYSAQILAAAEAGALSPPAGPPPGLGFGLPAGAAAPVPAPVAGTATPPVSPDTKKALKSWYQAQKLAHPTAGGAISGPPSIAAGLSVPPTPTRSTSQGGKEISLTPNTKAFVASLLGGQVSKGQTNKAQAQHAGTVNGRSRYPPVLDLTKKTGRRKKHGRIDAWSSAAESDDSDVSEEGGNDDIVVSYQHKKLFLPTVLYGCPSDRDRHSLLRPGGFDALTTLDLSSNTKLRRFATKFSGGLAAFFLSENRLRFEGRICTTYSDLRRPLLTSSLAQAYRDKLEPREYSEVATLCALFDSVLAEDYNRTCDILAQRIKVVLSVSSLKKEDRKVGWTNQKSRELVSYIDSFDTVAETSASTKRST